MRRSASLAAAAAAAVALAAASAPAQARDQREASVGMRAYVEQVVLPGTELETAPTSTEAPLVVRVLRTWPHGEHLRYDLEWVGFEPGTYDLTDYLVRRDGSSADDLPAVEVAVRSTLAADVFEPSEPDPEAADRVGGYTKLQIVVGVLWLAGLLAILFVGRRRRPRPAPAPAPPSLADRLRPLVEEVAAGRADDRRKAELERLLVAFWRARLDLGDAKASEALAVIRRHEEAGALLRRVEDWLHRPRPPSDVDVAALLEPYRTVTAESFAPIADAGTSGKEAG